MKFIVSLNFARCKMLRWYISYMIFVGNISEITWCLKKENEFCRDSQRFRLSDLNGHHRYISPVSRHDPALMSFNLIDSRHPASFFLLFPWLTRECIHKVAVHSASGLNYGSYFLWVRIAGWYPMFVYTSLRHRNTFVYSEVYVLFSLHRFLRLRYTLHRESLPSNMYNFIDGIAVLRDRQW